MKLLHAHRRPQAGFTLIELMIGLAVMAILVVLVAPSFLNMIDMQRLRGTSSQFVTDVQFARSEAISRQQVVGLTMNSSLDTTCYAISACPANTAPFACTCDCTLGEGQACSNNGAARELRTVVVQRNSMVEVNPTANLQYLTFNFVSFDPMTGGMQPWNIGQGGPNVPMQSAAWFRTSLVRDQRKTLRLMISQGGRPSVCTPSDELVSGTSVCPQP